MPVTKMGKNNPHIRSDINVSPIVGLKFRFSLFSVMFFQSLYVEHSNEEKVYEFNSYEWHNYAAHTINKGVLQEKSHRTCRLECYAPHSKRNQEWNDNCIEDER